MNFGPAPPVPAHDARHPLLPKRDLAMETRRPPVPGVPRAPRAAPKANSRGALSRELYRPRSSRSSTPTRTSELRRPRGDSPSTFARVSSLSREKMAVENQVFEMGPRAREDATFRTDFKRPHVLGQKGLGQLGIPWTEPKPEEPVVKDAGRRNTLEKERRQASQGLEWVPDSAALPPEPCSYRPRVELLKREECDSMAQRLEFASAVLDTNLPSKLGGAHGRKNVLAREGRAMSLDMPRAVSNEDVPFYGRRGIVEKEHAVEGKGHLIGRG